MLYLYFAYFSANVNNYFVVMPRVNFRVVKGGVALLSPVEKGGAVATEFFFCNAPAHNEAHKRCDIMTN